MAQITDLNVAPYYDDFNKEDNFHRVLFRPGYAIQARELTTLQSILQDQVEKHGSHFFKEGSMVIPGQVSYSKDYASLQLASIFGGETIRPSQFYNATTPITITGKTTGVTAKVVGFAEATSTTQPILYVQYISAGTDGETERFGNYGTNSSNGGYVAFSGANVITGSTSEATLTPSTTTETVTLANANTLTLTTGYQNPELQPDSGNIIYLENRKPIQRASDQTEDIKIIIEF